MNIPTEFLLPHMTKNRDILFITSKLKYLYQFIKSFKPDNIHKFGILLDLSGNPLSILYFPHYGEKFESCTWTLSRQCKGKEGEFLNPSETFS